jgi:hypothetical protein
VNGINSGSDDDNRLLTARWEAATTERPVTTLEESHQ